MARPKEITLGGDIPVTVIVKEGKLPDYKVPKSSLKKKNKIEKRAPPPKSLCIPSLTRPLAPVKIIKEQGNPANLVYHNSHHGLMRACHSQHRVPLKKGALRLGKKVRQYSSHIHRDQKLLGLFDK
jgi:hypothetical protein